MLPDIEPQIKDILAEIQNGEGARFNQLHGIERAYVERQTERIMGLAILLALESQRLLLEGVKDIRYAPTIVLSRVGVAMLDYAIEVHKSLYNIKL